jgi:hypothetical protein
MLETSSDVCPAKKRAQAKLHVSVMVGFESRFVAEARTLIGRRMMVNPIIDKVTRPFRSEILERLQAFGFDKAVQVTQVFQPNADGLARIAVRLEIRRIIGDPGGEIQNCSFIQCLCGPEEAPKPGRSPARMQ